MKTVVAKLKKDLAKSCDYITLWHVLFTSYALVYALKDKFITSIIHGFVLSCSTPFDCTYGKK